MVMWIEGRFCGRCCRAVGRFMPGAAQGEATTKKMIGIQVGAVLFRLGGDKVLG